MADPLILDPIDLVLLREQQDDHAQAVARGQRVRDLAEAVVAALVGPGLLPGTARDRAVNRDVPHPGG